MNTSIILSDNIQPKLKKIQGLWLYYGNRKRYVNVNWLNPIEIKYIFFLYPQYHMIETKE